MESKKDNKDENSSFYDTATKAVGVAGAIVAFAGLAFLSFASSSEEKMMKAPGADGFIRRAPFEANAKDYFKDQRQRNKK